MSESSLDKRMEKESDFFITKRRGRGAATSRPRIQTTSRQRDVRAQLEWFAIDWRSKATKTEGRIQGDRIQ